MPTVARSTENNNWNGPAGVLWALFPESASRSSKGDSNCRRGPGMTTSGTVSAIDRISAAKKSPFSTDGEPRSKENAGAGSGSMGGAARPAGTPSNVSRNPLTKATRGARRAASIVTLVIIGPLLALRRRRNRPIKLVVLGAARRFFP